MVLGFLCGVGMIGLRRAGEISQSCLVSNGQQILHEAT